MKRDTQKHKKTALHECAGVQVYFLIRATVARGRFSGLAVEHHHWSKLTSRDHSVLALMLLRLHYCLDLVATVVINYR